MKYVLLIYHGPNPALPGSDRWNALTQAEQKAIYADYAELNNTAGNSPGLPLGLPDAARTVQVLDGKHHVKDGSYLSESVAGYYVFEAETMEAAITLAARIPAARLGGAVEKSFPEIFNAVGKTDTVKPAERPFACSVSTSPRSVASFQK
jgi:hypothetical protein